MTLKTKKSTTRIEDIRRGLLKNQWCDKATTYQRANLLQSIQNHRTSTCWTSPMKTEPLSMCRLSSISLILIWLRPVGTIHSNHCLAPTRGTRCVYFSDLCFAPAGGDDLCLWSKLDFGSLGRMLLRLFNLCLVSSHRDGCVLPLRSLFAVNSWDDIVHTIPVWPAHRDCIVHRILAWLWPVRTYASVITDPAWL